MTSYNRKPPLVAAHDLPVEPPTGRPPRSPLRSLLWVIVFVAAFLFLLWIIEVTR